MAPNKWHPISSIRVGPLPPLEPKTTTPETPPAPGSEAVTATPPAAGAAAEPASATPSPAPAATPPAQPTPVASPHPAATAKPAPEPQRPSTSEPPDPIGDLLQAGEPLTASTPAGPALAAAAQPAAAPRPQPAPATVTPPPAPQTDTFVPPPLAQSRGEMTTTRSASSSLAPQGPFAPPASTSRTAAERQAADGRPLYAMAAGAGVLWIAGLAALVFAFQAQHPPFSIDGFALAVLAILGLAPFGFIGAAAYAANQGRRLAAEARRTQRLSEQLLSPAALAAAEAGSMVEQLRQQIDSTAEASNQAHETLLALREALALETERLAEATAAAQRQARGLTEVLGRERVEMTQLSVVLDARSAAVADSIARQAQMVKDAADLAEAQLREGQVILAGGAADLAAAAGEAADAARTAGGELSRQVGRLETAGTAVVDVMRTAEEGLTSQRAALVTVAHALRSDQEDFAALAESRTAQLAEFLTNARHDVGALGEVAAMGAQSVSELINKAAEQFRELAEAAERERNIFATSTTESLNALVAAGQRERDELARQMADTTGVLAAAAQEAREAAEVHAEAARSRVDQLNEAAFAAGLKADEVFDSRLNEAKRLIEQSARLVEDAGARAAERLDAGAAQAHQAMLDLQGMLDSIAERTAALPVEARARTQEVRDAVAQGMDSLLASARQASEETQAIDQAFQERVRRNYEMLSEAVQLMSIVAGGAAGAAPALSRPGPLPRVARTDAPAPAAPTAPANGGGPAAPAEPTTAQTAQPPTPGPAPSGQTMADDGLRPRLRLTPTASDQEFKAVFEQAGGRPAPEPATTTEDGWTWKELLGGLDQEDAAQAPEAGPEQLIGEIQAMGIDPSALLPKGRVDEIAAAVQTGDGQGAREVVRALAPAAIRRLSRRLMTDPTFNGQAVTYVRRYATQVGEVVVKDRQGYQVAAELATPAGRAYLLLDAAVGERP
jgi:hypothetical protein